MLTIKSTQIKNNAYNVEVTLVATSEGFYSNVEVVYCTPHFKVWENEDSKMYSSLQEAEEEFQFNVEWNKFIAASAKAKLEAHLLKCMSPTNLIWQKQMEEIKELISLPVLLEIKTLIPKSFEECDEVLVYQYSTLLVVEYYPPDGESIGVSLFLNGEEVYNEYTHLDSGYLVTPELAIKHYFE